VSRSKTAQGRAVGDQYGFCSNNSKGIGMDKKSAQTGLNDSGRLENAFAFIRTNFFPRWDKNQCPNPDTQASLHGIECL
jgi:hypothetical protein